MLDDKIVQHYTGMRTYHYISLRTPPRDPRPYNERFFDEPFPENRAVVCLYMTYPCFKHIPKPYPYRCFFVMRDPRDIAVSWYYSLRYSHPLERKGENDIRSILNKLPQEDGLIHSINTLLRPGGIYDGLRSWSREKIDDTDVKVFRFEDLFGPLHEETMARFFEFLGIMMSEADLKRLLDNYSFKRLSGGRIQNQEDKKHHYRRGVAGGWKDEFTPKVHASFKELTGDLVEVLGYEPC
ncbi:MAG: sulfotransferase domain-containing protein [Proteobacteria bacterium]|nr:sulfotransferase domain-containing protein [Pseudomonadota bacterium]